MNRLPDDFFASDRLQSAKDTPLGLHAESFSTLLRDYYKVLSDRVTDDLLRDLILSAKAIPGVKNRIRSNTSHHREYPSCFEPDLENILQYLDGLFTHWSSGKLRSIADIPLYSEYDLQLDELNSSSALQVSGLISLLRKQPDPHAKKYELPSSSSRHRESGGGGPPPRGRGGGNGGKGHGKGHHGSRRPDGHSRKRDDHGSRDYNRSKYQRRPTFDDLPETSKACTYCYDDDDDDDDDDAEAPKACAYYPDAAYLTTIYEVEEEEVVEDLLHNEKTLSHANSSFDVESVPCNISPVDTLPVGDPPPGDTSGHAQLKKPPMDPTSVTGFDDFVQHYFDTSPKDSAQQLSEATEAFVRVTSQTAAFSGEAAAYRTFGHDPPEWTTVKGKWHPVMCALDSVEDPTILRGLKQKQKCQVMQRAMALSLVTLRTLQAELNTIYDNIIKLQTQSSLFATSDGKYDLEALGLDHLKKKIRGCFWC